MSLPQVVSREEWLVARTELLDEEKELTRRRDALNAKRRMLPMVEIEKDYVLLGPDGEASLLDLFEGRLQLIVKHFMFDPSWDEGCPSCTAGTDEIADGLLEHLYARDTTLVQVSRAPLEKIERYKAKRGWTVPWYSSYGSDFNYDFHVTLDESVAPVQYNYRPKSEYEARGLGHFVRGEQPGTVFLIEPRIEQPDEPMMLDAHGMDPVKVLSLAGQLGPVPERILVVGCEPLTGMSSDDEELVGELSDPVRAAVGVAVELVEQTLAELLGEPEGGTE